MNKKKKTKELKCPACGIAYVEHLGLHGTCVALQTTLEQLRTIALLRNARMSRQLAGATAAFIQTQLEEARKAGRRLSK